MQPGCTRDICRTVAAEFAKARGKTSPSKDVKGADGR